MDEPQIQEEIEGKKQKKTVEEESPLIKETEKLKQAAEAWKVENDKRTEILEREERLMARKEALNALGGGSIVANAPTKTEEELKKEKAMEFWKGSDIEKSIEKHG